MDSIQKGESPSYISPKKSGGAVIALLIMGIGLLTTGFFTGWMYFQVKDGFGPGKSKDKKVPMAVIPIGGIEDPLSILGPDNLSWAVLATRGKFGLLIQYKAKPSQGITLELKEGTSPGRLLLSRQKLPTGEETWTIALGNLESPSLAARQTLRVNPKGEEKPITRPGSVPLTNIEPVELALMKWNPAPDAPEDAPTQASLIWYPPPGQAGEPKKAP